MGCPNNPPRLNPIKKADPITRFAPNFPPSNEATRLRLCSTDNPPQNKWESPCNESVQCSPTRPEGGTVLTWGKVIVVEPYSPLLPIMIDAGHNRVGVCHAPTVIGVKFAGVTKQNKMPRSECNRVVCFAPMESGRPFCRPFFRNWVDVSPLDCARDQTLRTRYGYQPLVFCFGLWIWFLLEIKKSCDLI